MATMNDAPSEMSPEFFLHAYAAGFFPMAKTARGKASWYAPHERGLIPLDERFYVRKRLARTIRKAPYKIHINRNFPAVIAACKTTRGNKTWINDAIKEVFVHLHQLGHAHSVETYDENDVLVGGLYGLALGGAFVGESMFSTARDASKIALVHLVGHLRERGFTLLDAQFQNDHLEQFGAYTLPQNEYLELLGSARALDVRF